MSKIVKRNSRKELAERMNEQLRVQTLSNDSYQNCLRKVLEGTADLKDLLSVNNKEKGLIDFSQCQRKIKTIQLIYSAGSQVGACTVVAGNMFTVKLTEKSAETFKKALKMLKENESHESYKTIWVEGYNKHVFKFADGTFYEYYVVTNEEIKELERRIKAMDYNRVTLEELQRLQNDLPPFVRAWQESSIDVAKDKDKVFNKQFNEFFEKVEVISTYLKKKQAFISNNFDELKVLHRAGRVNDMHYNIKLPYNSDVMPDMLGDVNYAIHAAVERYMNGDLLDMYKRSNRNYFKQFADACLPYPELALFIQQVYGLCTQSYHEDCKIDKDQYADLRNKIYTKAAVYGVEGAEVVKVAVSVAMRYVKETTVKDERVIDLGTANVDNYRESKVTHIFPREYEVLRTNQPVIEKLNIIWMQKGRDIVEGEEVEFAAGFSADDTVEVEEMFTGTAYNKDGELVYNVDVYAYDKSKSFITMATFAEGTNTQEQLTDEGEFANEFFKANTDIILAGKRQNVIVDGHDGKTLVAKVVSSKELSNNGKPARHTITNVMSYQPNAGRARIFLIEVQ